MTAAARRLLAVGSGGGFVIVPGPSGALYTLTSTPQGGWTQIQDAKAVHYNGATYFGYAPDTGSTSDIVVGKYVHTTETTTTTVLASAYENPPDNHSSPAVLVRSSDKRIIVAAARHAETNSPKIWISTNPEDISAFGAAIEPDPSIGAAQYTYMILYEIANGDIYLFYRDYISGTNTGRLGFTKSTDGGTTWAGRKILYTGASGEVPYWRIVCDGIDRFDVFVTDVEPDASALGHFYYDATANTVHASDGTGLTWNGTTTVLDWSDITLVQGATCWAWGGSTNEDGPAVVIMRDIGSDNAIDVARWRSGAWQVDEVVASVGGTVTGNQYASGCAIHHTDPDIVYAARKVSGKFEQFRYTSSDDGATWTEEQLTSGSAKDNIWVDTVHNPGSGLEAIWLYGDYTSDTSYAFGIRGWG